MSVNIDRLRAALAGRYRIERELGGGGMSHVYLAEETALGRKVVVKVIASDLAEGLSTERFAREVHLAARLQQANIVPVLTAGEADGLPYYTMPFVRGESLRARFATGTRLPLGEAVSLLRDVARALAFAHGEGVIHRDIKPENILLSGGAAVVTDFGIAKAISVSRTQDGSDSVTLTQAGSSIGTPAYMAPEQSAGGETDHRADLYAWGVTAYETLTGHHPFAHRKSAAQMIGAHIAESPAALPADIPKDLAALVLQCLEKDPARRPATADAVITRLSAIGTGSGEHTAAPSRAVSRPVVAIAAAVVVLAGVAGWWFGRGGGAAEDGRTVVVLPFANLGSPDDAYFADGVSDEIASQLARIPGMMVVARNSAQRFKGSDRPPQDIARELGAAYVLSGSVRWARMPGAAASGGTEVRIVPALVRTSTGEQLWGEPYQQQLTDVFRVQTDVAERVAAALSVEIGQDQHEALRTTDSRDPVARDAQLLGRSLLRQRGLLNLRRAVSEFGRAIERDSGYAKAWAGYSLAYGYLPVYFDTTTAEKAQAEAERAARRAVELDSLLPEAHMALAQVRFHQVRLREALASADRAVALDPSAALAHKDRAEILLTQGKVKEAAIAMRRAVALDPLMPVVHADMSIIFAALGQIDSALASTHRSIELDPENPFWYFTLANQFAVKGQRDSAIAACRLGVGTEQSCHMVNDAFFDPARRAPLLAFLGALGRRSDPLWPAWSQALYYARLGETDSAFARLRIAVRNGQQEFYGTISSPWMAPLRRDPRWEEIVGAMQRQ